MNRTLPLAFLLTLLTLPLAACGADTSDDLTEAEGRSPAALCPEVIRRGSCISEPVCLDGATISTPAAWLQAPGDYVITLTTAEATVTCSFARVDGDPYPTASCSDSRQVKIKLPSDTSEGLITFEVLPASVHLQVVHNNAIIQEEQVDLSYVARYPNGFECGNACCRADAAISGATPQTYR